jgi:hypothetical protein
MVFSIGRQNRSFGSMMMSEEDVYSARDGFLRDPASKGGAGTHWLPPVNADKYLAYLGMQGILEGPRNWGTEASTLANLEDFLGSSACQGIMVVIGNHWVAVLNPLWVTRQQPRTRVFYDPSPHQVPHALDLSLPVIAKYLHKSGPRYVVRVPRTP